MKVPPWGPFSHEKCSRLCREKKNALTKLGAPWGPRSIVYKYSLYKFVCFFLNVLNLSSNSVSSMFRILFIFDMFNSFQTAYFIFFYIFLGSLGIMFVILKLVNNKFNSKYLCISISKILV